MRPLAHPPSGGHRGTSLALEAFARDLMALVRGVRVYPVGHPYLTDLAGRLLALVHRDLPEPLEVGVLPGELQVGDAYAGGRNTRAGQLAAHLHARRVLRVIWAKEVTPGHVFRFADLLADPALQGEALRRAMAEGGIPTIGLDLLDVARLHDTFREGGHDAVSREGRGREGWEWLLQDGVAAEEIAEALTSALPLGGTGSRGVLVPEEAVSLALVLVRLGERLTQVLEVLPEVRRGALEEEIGRLGDGLSARELAAVVGQADRTGGLHGPAVAALTRDLGGERLVELLAVLAAAEGRSTRRLADVFRRFAPPAGADELLPMVRARLGSARQGLLVNQIWRAVEAFLLELKEDPFLGEEYAASLEALGARDPAEEPSGEILHLDEEPSGHLDRVLVCLAADDPDGWAGALLERLEARAAELSAGPMLELLARVDADLPGFLDARPEALERLFQGVAGRLRDLDRLSRDQLLAFAVRHEGALLAPVLRALGGEERISVRRFLVDVLCAFSHAATPAIVARLRSSPWYVTRNLAIALGRRGEARVVPALRALLAHDHPKVRREAVLALGSLDTLAAQAALAEVDRGRLGTAAEQELARRVLAAGSGVG